MSLTDDAMRREQDEELRAVLDRTQRALARSRAKSEDLVAATLQSARDAFVAAGPLPPVPAPRKLGNRTGRPEVALWDTGDWQLSKTTTSYNTQVATERLALFAEKAVRLTNIQRSAHPVDEAVIVFGGDIVEGLFNFPTQPFEVDMSLFGQWATASKLCAGMVRTALANYSRVTVVAEWGNHGRIGSKRDVVPKHDNIDRMVYETARIMLEGERRLTWQDCPEDIQRLEVGNYRALVIHGDEIGRNGFASPMTIVQHANRWRSGAYPWDFRDVYSHHYHTHAEWPMANGEGAVYQTGSTESDNRYARENLAASAIPSQRVHFIDPDKGRVTAQYKVTLA